MIFKTLDDYKEVIDEYPDETSTAMMEYCVNKNLDGINKECFNQINEIGDY